nr:hypothetical protein CFP56_38958 [Quercus suber]
MRIIGETAKFENALSPAVEPTLYVLVPPSPLFAAHWSFFLPEMLPYDSNSKRCEESTMGRRIHVCGNRLTGFQLEIVRDYNVRKHLNVSNRQFPIAKVPLHVLQKCDGISTSGFNEKECYKDEDEGGGYVSNDPIDIFERICVEVHAPGPSLTQVGTGAELASRPGKRAKIHVKDCQWWILQVVEALRSKDLLKPLPTVCGQETTEICEVMKRLPNH